MARIFKFYENIEGIYFRNDNRNKILFGYFLIFDNNEIGILFGLLG